MGGGKCVRTVGVPHEEPTTPPGYQHDSIGAFAICKLEGPVGRTADWKAVGGDSTQTHINRMHTQSVDGSICDPPGENTGN